jgi:hypothetical protein
MGFLEKITRMFSNDKTIANKKSQVEIFETKESSEFTIQKENFSVDSPKYDGNINIIGSDEDVEGRYVEDIPVKKETERERTEEEKFLREQQRIMRELRIAHIPEFAVCSVNGCERRKDSPLFIGQDGKYYCRDHILPENSGRKAAGKPPLEGHGTISYHSDGMIEYKK